MSRSRFALVAALVVAVAVSVVTWRALDAPEPPAEAAPTVPATAPAPTTAPPTLPPPTTVPPLDPACTVTGRVGIGDSSADVRCIESQLASRGVLAAVPDEIFDETTLDAVKAFQRDQQLVVDGVVGKQTARALGAWSDAGLQPPDPALCTPVGHSAVVDRFNQRAWLCEGGVITRTFPVTSAWTQPDPGTYAVYEKELDASSALSGRLSTMTHFVAFTHGKYQGARIAFHSVPVYTDGEYVQTLDSVGSDDMRGDSSGCIRVLPDDALVIWDFLQVGDAVVIAT